jgi:hypothetical protein
VAGIVTEDPNGITNQMEIAYDRKGVLGILTASNDFHVRRLNIERNFVSQSIELPWAVNVRCNTLID